MRELEPMKNANHERGSFACLWPLERTTAYIAIILGFAVRAWQLGRLNLWLDEGFTVWCARKPVAEILSLSLTDEPNPPGYPLLMSAWMSIFGESETALRAPSLIFGTASIYLVWRIGNRLVSPRVGALAAVALAGNPFFVEFSREARAYAALTFFCLLAFDSMPGAARPWNLSRRLIHAFSIAAALLAHAYGAFLLASLSIYFVGRALGPSVEHRRVAWWWAAVVMPAAIVGVPWYFAFALHSEAYRAHFAWLEKVPPKSVSELLEQYYGIGAHWGPLVVCVWLVLVAFVSIRVHRREEPSGESGQGLMALVIFTLLTLGVPVAMAAVWHPVFFPRYGIAAAAVGVVWLLAPFTLVMTRSRALFTLAILAFATDGAMQTSRFLSQARREEWQAVIESVAKASGPQVLVLNPSYYSELPPAYYSRKLGIEQRLTLLPLAKFESDAFDNERIWIANVRENKTPPHLMQRRGFTLAGRSAFYWIELEEWRRQGQKR